MPRRKGAPHTAPGGTAAGASGAEAPLPEMSERALAQPERATIRHALTVRERLEQREIELLSPYAAKAAYSRGRRLPEPESPVRTCFQRDRDRIVHSKAFRRLKDKTQVFIAPPGDHYITRLTHVLQVSQVARTIARALNLNEDLTEAIAMGHDLGHTPFGHAGEEVLNELHPGGFRHAEQSLRVVDVLEENRGLNLTWEVRNGIISHSKPREGITAHYRGLPSRAGTLEGEVVRYADVIAYLNHDIDDAERAGIIREEDIPLEVRQELGTGRRERINTMVLDVVESSWGVPEIRMSPRVLELTNKLRDFMFERVYLGSDAKREEQRARRLIETLYTYFVKHPDQLPEDFYRARREAGDDVSRIVCDYIAGLTERYAIEIFNRIYVPQSYVVVGVRL
jgi:dGTPase